MEELQIKAGESELQYIWRVCSVKDSGMIDLTWDELADVINKNTKADETDYLGSSAYRKKYQYGKMLYDEVFSKMVSTSYADEIKSERFELEKEKVKVRDERNELKRIIREQARKESYNELFKELLSDQVFDGIEYEHEENSFDENDLIIPVTDLHTGININNFWNTYNVDVLKERLRRYADKIIQVQELHRSENAYVIIGEVLSGLIHPNLRCENNQNVIEQFLVVCNYLSDFLNTLSYHFNTINVYVTPGNHSRVSPKKEENLKGENFDNLVIPYLSAMLQNNKKVKFNENRIEESIAMFSVRGNRVMASHGDKDKVSDVVQKFSILFGMIPDLVYMGHLHCNKMETIGNTKVIQSGCISGIDNYALDLRCNTRPEQTVSVINAEGLVCLYDIQLD